MRYQSPLDVYYMGSQDYPESASLRDLKPTRAW